ncbi:MAG: hypothetical protein WCP52_04600 [Bacteroidota bacterium]
MKKVEYIKSRSFAGEKTPAKARLLEELKEAVEEMKLIKAGKKKARPVEDLLNEL